MKIFLSVPKEVPGIDNTEILEDFEEKVDYNLQDHKGRSAFILACQQDETNGPKEDNVDARKESVKLFLNNAERLGINLYLHDFEAKTGFDYFPKTWLEEFQNEMKLKTNLKNCDISFDNLKVL